VTTNGYVTAEQLLDLSGKRDYRDVVLETPSGQLKFRLRSLTEAEWAEISAGNFDVRRGGLSQEGLKASDAKLLAACLVDGEGNQLLPGPDGYRKVGKLGTQIVEPLLRAAREICGLRELQEPAGNFTDESDSGTSSAE